METALFAANASFAANRFRLLGLSARASAADIRAAAAACARDARIGRSRRTPLDFAGLGEFSRSEEGARRASSELADPRVRIVERLVWPVDESAPLARFLRAFLEPLSVGEEDPAGSALTAWVSTLLDETAIDSVERVEASGGFDRLARGEDFAVIRKEWSAVVAGALALLVSTELRAGDSRGAHRLLTLLKESPAAELFKRTSQLLLGRHEDDAAAECDAWQRDLSARVVRENEGVAEANLEVCQESEASLRKLVSARRAALATLAEVTDAWDGVRVRYALAAQALSTALTWADAWEESARVLKWAAKLAAGTAVHPRMEAALSEAEDKLAKSRAERDEENLTKEDMARGRRHRIEITGSGSGLKYRFPRICACCLRPTEDCAVLQKSQSVPGGTSTIRVDVPTCEACHAHERDAARLLRNVTMFALIGASAVALILWAGFSSTSATAWVGGCGWAAVIGGGIGFRHGRQLEALDETHAARSGAVRIRQFVKNGFALECAHPIFAQLAASANASMALVAGDRKPRRSVAEANEPARLVVVAIALLSGGLGAFGPGLVKSTESRATQATTDPPPRQPTRSSTTPPPTLPVAIGPLARDRQQVEAEKRRLGSAIDALKVRIEGLEGEIEAMDAEIKQLSADIDSTAATLNVCKRAYITLANADNKERYLATLRQHNSLVDRHNGLLEKRRATYTEYSIALESHNAQVASFNQLLTR